MRAEPRRRLTASIRFRLLAWFVLLLALATVASVVVVREILRRGVAERVDASLVQEVEELRALVQGNDPETGRPFRADVRRIFEVFLERNFPTSNEAYITFVRGELFLRSPARVPYRLDLDRALTERWRRLERSERGTVATPAGVVDYLAVPVRTEGRPRGVFVAAAFTGLEIAEVEPAIYGAGLIGLVVLVIGSVLAWRLATQILRPVEEVRSAAYSISESDLSRRIEVRGDDEIADLARTFNEMLDRLEAAFSTQRRFLDDASHELRTPITVIRGHLELFEDDPAERAKTIALVTDELDRMSRFVNDLLLLARARRPDFLKLEAVDVAGVTEDVHHKAVALAPRDWRVESLGQGRIVADRQRLTQALMQLADNASKHTEEGAPIWIGSELADGKARFWVRDSGPGIDPAEGDALFERFRRGRGSERKGGLGLGLAIVQAIARAHHGTVEVHSAPGAGSTFTLSIPVDQPEPMEVRG
jgi:signal transduction histidine kinase